MWHSLIYFGMWLFAVCSFLGVYRRVGRPVPWLLISLLLFFSAYGAYRFMASQEGQVWVRAVLAGLFILAGAGVIVINRRIRSRTDVVPRMRGLQGLRILFVVNNVIFLSLSVFAILQTNVPLADLM